MGADIYLRSQFEPHNAKHRAAFDAAVIARDAKYPRGSFMPEDNPEQRAVSDAYDAMYAVGYFRDSYNATSLFGFLGISWWQSCGDSKYAWEIDGEGNMQVPSMEALKRYLEDFGAVTCDQMKAWHQAHPHVVVDDGENSLTAWGKMFERKRRSLIVLLSEAIALGEPLDCSV